ncbi:taste receptor type 2 member 19-like [Trachypithecus francoisi]|uniref:taste receptor type 2 member 19-like n=1 Tax=Trachypithecus francoisi TaxID=54180 RepID=UPI00141AFDF0|nr:taste receptor type 2 member 19-like [Trachypithecus francoisi]
MRILEKNIFYKRDENSTVFTFTLFSLEVEIVASNVSTTTKHFSIWLLLASAYFVCPRFDNFCNLIFLHLKKRIKNVALVILLGPLEFLIHNLALVTTDESVWTKEYEGNLSWKIKLRNAIHLSNMAVPTLANFTPFTPTLIAFLLLICSPCKHLKKMQLHGKGSQDLSTKVHIKAFQTMISFLMLFGIYFLCLITSTWNSRTQQSKLVFLLCQTLAVMYPSFHSLILILGNRKPKQTFLFILGPVTC